MAPVDVAVEARKRNVDQHLSLKYYYRTADNILRQAEVYRREQNEIQLYVFLGRFCSLILETIPQHNEFKAASYYVERQEFKKRARDAVEEMERLKAVVRTLNSSEQQAEGRPQRVTKDVPTLPSAPVHGVVDPRAPLDLLTGSMDHLAVTPVPAASFSIPRPRDETLSRHSFFALPPQERLRAPSKVAYPTSFIDDSPVLLPSLDPSWATPAALPPQDETVETKLIRQPSPPPMEAPVHLLPARPHPQPHPSAVADPRPGPPPAVAMEDLSDNSKGPKGLHISSGMMEEFMRLVKANTERNLETCGVLAGTLKKGVFYITALVLPKQKATSDSCQTVNEEEIFEAQDKRGLFQLGWIHTHPSQSCFMSSIDLHTHYSYQVMLPEAVAIVMAPSDNNRKFGIFRLADPGGVKVIQSCQLRGFHTHESPPGGGVIYEHCAHVFINPNLNFDVIDLR